MKQEPADEFAEQCPLHHWLIRLADHLAQPDTSYRKLRSGSDLAADRALLISCNLHCWNNYHRISFNSEPPARVCCSLIGWVQYGQGGSPSLSKVSCTFFLSGVLSEMNNMLR